MNAADLVRQPVGIDPVRICPIPEVSFANIDIPLSCIFRFAFGNPIPSITGYSAAQTMPVIQLVDTKKKK